MIKRELTDQLQVTVDFLNEAWENFLTVFCNEIDISYDLAGILPAAMLNDLQNGETA